MLNQLNTTTKRELDAKYLSEAELQGSKDITNTSGTLSIPDYGMTESIELYFKPTQDLHGYDKPWAGGAGKNLLPMTVDGIKSANTYGTWNGNSYTLSGVTFSLKSDDGVSVTSISTSGNSSGDIYFRCGAMPLSKNTNYILSGCAASGEADTYNLYLYRDESETLLVRDIDESEIPFTAVSTFSSIVNLMVKTGVNMDNKVFYPMIRLATETDATFEPYSNICPIVGQDNASLSWNTNQGIAMNFGTTYYGGVANFEGTLTHDWQQIASYDGETLSGEWLSDRDEYAPGTTPSTGAEVVYKTTPSTVRVTKPVSLNLTDEYPITYNGYKLDVTYQPKDTVLEEAKNYTNQEIAKLGIPQPPISNGNYNLVCTVASGVPTLSWESTT